MNGFGFHIVPSSTINLDKVDRTKLKELAKAEPDILRCMACGSCSATCPAGKFSGMSIRKLILFLERGREKEAINLTRCCMLCGKCMMVCPRGINTRHIMLAVSRIYDDITTQET